VAHVALWTITTALTASYRLAAPFSALVRFWMETTATLKKAAIKLLMPGGKAVLRMLCCIPKLVSIGAQGKCFPAYCFTDSRLHLGPTEGLCGLRRPVSPDSVDLSNVLVEPSL
jgi:hypothetical protein